MKATLTTRGRVTIPKEIRDVLGLRAGSRLDFVLEKDGALRLIPLKGAVKELKGILPSPERPVTLEGMEETIRERARSGKRRVGFLTGQIEVPDDFDVWEYAIKEGYRAMASDSARETEALEWCNALAPDVQ